MEEHRAQGGSSVHLTLRILQPSQARLPILRRGTADMLSRSRFHRVGPLAGLSRKIASVQSRQHASDMPCRDPRIYRVILSGPTLWFVRPTRTSQSGFVGNVVIRCSDEMSGSGRLAERLDRHKRVTSGRLDGVAPWLFENDPLDPATPDFRAGPVFTPFRPTMESCISAILLWVILTPDLRLWQGCPRYGMAVLSETLETSWRRDTHMNDILNEALELSPFCVLYDIGKHPGCDLSRPQELTESKYGDPTSTGWALSTRNGNPASCFLPSP